MHYINILSDFRTDYEGYGILCSQDASIVPLVNDKDKEKKIIKCVPLFEDTLSHTFGSKGPLVYIVRENTDVLAEADNPIDTNSHYGSAGSLLEELNQRFHMMGLSTALTTRPCT